MTMMLINITAAVASDVAAGSAIAYSRIKGVPIHLSMLILGSVALYFLKWTTSYCLHFSKSAIRKIRIDYLPSLKSYSEIRSSKNRVFNKFTHGLTTPSKKMFSMLSVFC